MSYPEDNSHMNTVHIWSASSRCGNFELPSDIPVALIIYGSKCNILALILHFFWGGYALLLNMELSCASSFLSKNKAEILSVYALFQFGRFFAFFFFFY